jgi:hypothetical protein
MSEPALPVCVQVARPASTTLAASWSSCAAVGGHFLGDTAAQLGQSAALGAGVEVVGGFGQRRGRQAGRDLDDAVFDLAIGGDENDQRAAGAEGGELYVLDRTFGFGGEHHAGGLTEAGQHRGGVGQSVVQAAAVGGELLADGIALVVAEFAELKQAVHEEAQAAFGRKPSGGGVGGEEEAGFGEVGHDIADGSRRERDRETAGKGAAADGLAGADILFDDLAEDGGGARV